MEIENAARGQSAAIPMKDKGGYESLVAIIKYTFVVDPFGKVELDEHTGASPYYVDVCWGDDPATSSIKKPSDLCDYKPGTDVILVGHAHPRGIESAVDVTMRVGSVAKTVRAHGLRVWQSGLLGLSPGPALAIREPIPLMYELAWGGLDLAPGEKPLGEPRNYVGRGIARETKKLLGQPAAQLEDPAHPLGGLKNVPWNVGAIHRHWQPRVAFAGTYDEVWIETKMPLPPNDFDVRFNVTVPHDQWSETPLRGDEPVEILGARPEGPWRFQLPRIAMGFQSSTLGVEAAHRTHLDTFLIDADAGRVELTWRARVPMPRKYEMIDFVRIYEKEVLA